VGVGGVVGGVKLPPSAPSIDGGSTVRNIEQKQMVTPIDDDNGGRPLFRRVRKKTLDSAKKGPIPVFSVPQAADGGLPPSAPSIGHLAVIWTTPLAVSARDSIDHFYVKQQQFRRPLVLTRARFDARPFSFWTAGPLDHTPLRVPARLSRQPNNRPGEIATPSPRALCPPHNWQAAFAVSRNHKRNHWRNYVNAVHLSGTTNFDV
jgi:hypothetical protein